MPPWLPWHHPLVYISGFCEIAFGLFMLSIKTRRSAAWLIILLLIAVFPANVQMMLNDLNQHHPDTWLSVIRLPLQIILIWWAYQYAKDQKARL